MAENTFSDILSVNVDSNETRFYNLSAAETLTVGPNGEVSFNASQSTIPGILNTTASYAITASYAMNGGSGGSTDTGSLLKTASFSNPNISFTKGDSTSFNVDISSLNVTTASYARTASYSKTLGASLFNDEGSGNARLALLSSDGTYISTVNYLTSSLALTASSAVSSSYASNGGVTQIIAGTNITLSPTNGLGAVTINSTGGGSGAGANVTASFTNQSTWTFTHALANRGVVVQTFDTSWNQTIPQSITLTDDNTATITFPLSQSGYAIASLGGVVSTAATASYVLNAVSASYAATASLAPNYVLTSVTSSMSVATASYVNNLNQNVSISGVTSLGNGTFTKAGSATGDILLDNNSTDTPGVLMYYANNSNYGIDSWNGSFDVLSGQLVRITNKLNETGGAVKMAVDTSGNVVFTGFVKANAWRAGQVINDIALSNTEVTISTTTIATSTSDTDFLTYSYTPLSSTSYLVIHYHLASYDFSGGTGNDSYFSRIKVDGTEITYARQSTVNGNRSGVLFPLTGRYTNSNTTAKSIVVACRRDSADDSITIVNTATSMWLRITEIAR